MTPEEIAAVQARYGVGPSVAADLALVVDDTTRDSKRHLLLLIRRKNKPFQNCWALPGGFVELDEDLEDAARRELSEETGIADLSHVPLVQVCTCGHPDRDPRGRVISVVYLARMSEGLLETRAGDDAADARYFLFSDGVVWDDSGNRVSLAFDHDAIVWRVWGLVMVADSQS